MKEFFKSYKKTGSITIKMDDAKGTWSADKGEIIYQIVKISNEYKAAGDTLTLRQLYYQLVSRDIIPNHDKVYKKISSLKDDVVYAGLVDWNIFEDRGRVPINAYYEDSVEGAIERTIDSYSLDKQIGQPKHIEVWTEKDAISGILKKVTLPYTISLVVNKGYSSSTAMYAAYRRFLAAMEHGQQVVILYFGDHDPSGIDMIRDIYDRIHFMFVNGEGVPDDLLHNQIQDWWDNNERTIYDIADYKKEYSDVLKMMEEDSEYLDKLFDKGKIDLWLHENEMFQVIPIGLTMEQIKEYKPPHNPAKITDPRAVDYISKYGSVSWEVDALSPKIMREIVLKNILNNMDEETYQVIVKQESSDIERLKKMIGK